MEKKLPIASGRFNWIVVVLSAWVLIGLYIDGWAHQHLDTLDTFFTPWHAIFYSGYLSLLFFVSVTVYKNYRKGYRLRESLPYGYHLALIGLCITGFAGFSDLIWHTLLGIEKGVEALLSPPHLVAATGGALFIIGPLRNLSKEKKEYRTLGSFLPVLLSITLLTSLITFFTQFASPLVFPWASIQYFTIDMKTIPIYQSLGVASIVLHSAFIVAALLFLTKHFHLPFGSITLFFFINTALMSILNDQYMFIPFLTVAGIVADFFYKLTKKAQYIRLFSFSVPSIYFLLYFLSLIIAGGISWSLYLWLGSIFMAGLTGLLLSFLAYPSAIDEHA